MRPRAVILSGGPASVLDPGAPLPPPEFYTAGVPILGICYGEQAMAQQLGGTVEGGHHREFGRAEVEVTGDCALFDGRVAEGRKIPGVDEPWRPGDAAAGGLSRGRAPRPMRRSP